MKKIINWFKDFFYSLTDYALILTIIVLIAVVLIWKFNDLFSLGFDKKTLADNDNTMSIVHEKEDETNNANSNTDNKESETSNENEGNDNSNDSDSESNNSNDSDSENDNSNGNDAESDNSNDSDSENDNSNNTDKENSNDNQNESTFVEQKEIEINIPAGSYSTQIAEILANSGLVESKKVFLSRCSELKLDTKLKAGKYTIKSGTKLDDIIKLLTK